MSPVTLYHNPRCSNSRNVLAVIRHAGIEPTIVEYLQNPPSLAELVTLARTTGLGPRGLLREKEPLFEQLQLGAPERTPAELFDALHRNPSLLARPLVVTARGAALCRPPETVFELLPLPGPLPPCVLENGQQVWDSGHRRATP